MFPILTLALATLLARADDDKKKSEFDPKVTGILKQVGDLYKNAKSMHVDATIATEGVEGKRSVKCEATYDIERPNHFALRTKLNGSADAGPDLVCDGKKCYAQDKRIKQYTESEPAEDLHEIATKQLPELGLQHVGLLFQNLLTDDPNEALMTGVTAASYAGKEKVDGEESHHLKFDQPGLRLKWELWVSATDKPVVLKFLGNLDGDDGKQTFTETFRNWKLDAKIKKDAFDFTPNAASKKVRSLQAN
jgi:hypothetical protein